MGINLEPGFVAARAFFERSIVASEANAGLDAAIKSLRLDSCKSPGLGPEVIFGLKVHNFGPRLLNHRVALIAQLGTNNKSKHATYREVKL